MTLDIEGSYPGNSFSGGYTCYQCGQWVPEGSCHYHPWGSWPNIWHDQREAIALERIAAALEKIADKLGAR